MKGTENITPAMKEILLTFLSDYTDTRTKPFSIAIAMEVIEANKSILTDDEVKTLFTWMNDFAKRFNSAWRWQRQKIVADSIRSLNG